VDLLVSGMPPIFFFLTHPTRRLPCPISCAGARRTRSLYEIGPRALPLTWKHPIWADRAGIRGVLASIGTCSILYYFSDLLHSPRHSNALRTQEHVGRWVCVTTDDAHATQVRCFPIYFSLSLSFPSPIPEQGQRNGHVNATRCRTITLWATTSPCEPPASPYHLFPSFSYPFHSPRHANTSRILKGP